MIPVTGNAKNTDIVSNGLPLMRLITLRFVDPVPWMFKDQHGGNVIPLVKITSIEIEE